MIEGGRAKFRPVKTGITGVTDIEIVEGLQENIEIVTGSYRVLRELKHLARIEKEKQQQPQPARP